MKTLVRSMIFIVIALVVLGAVLVFTASSTYSEVKFDNIYFLFKSHIAKLVIALLAGIVFAMIPYEKYKEYSKPLLFGVIALLILTLLLGSEAKGARRWLNLGVIRFQPSEVAKLVLFMHLAGMITRKGKLLKDFKHGLQYTLVWIFIIAGLVLVQPNLSTSMIIIFTSFTILYIGGARIRHIAATLGTASIAGGAAMMLFSHSRQRILGFIHSFNNGHIPNIQVVQAKIGLGSGGLFGVGIGQSRQSDLFLPESYGDFIFSILGEQFGLLGTVLVLTFFFALFIIGVIIAKKAKDEYGQLLGFAISFNIIISAFINAGVVTDLLPTTGITLPFISFGGTSIILFCASIGILINIAHQSSKSIKPKVKIVE